MKLSSLKYFLKEYWWLIIIPFVPVALNFLLPLGHWSKIGGENSTSIWLSFWASFSNSLIYCFVTFWVLRRQIKNDAKQNDLNRTSNENENALNRNDNITQNNPNWLKLIDLMKHNYQIAFLKATMNSDLTDYLGEYYDD